MVPAGPKEKAQLEYALGVLSSIEPKFKDHFFRRDKVALSRGLHLLAWAKGLEERNGRWPWYRSRLRIRKYKAALRQLEKAALLSEKKLGVEKDAKLVNELALKNISEARIGLVIAWGEIGDKRGLEPLIKMLKEDADPRIRKLAALTVWKFGDEAVGPLIGALDDADRDVRLSAAVALGDIAGKATGALPALHRAALKRPEEREMMQLAINAIAHRTERPSGAREVCEKPEDLSRAAAEGSFFGKGRVVSRQDY